MRTFDEFPNNNVCVVCGTNENIQCVLIGIQGTQDEGIVEAIPVHVRCIDPEMMIYNKDVGLIYIMDYTHKE